eukprot:2841994-Pyramimonas_sp.AAC.1
MKGPEVLCWDLCWVQNQQIWGWRVCAPTAIGEWKVGRIGRISRIPCMCEAIVRRFGLGVSGARPCTAIGGH